MSAAEARDLFRVDPTNPSAYFNIAQCYRNMGNYERARFFFRRYLTLEPKASNHRRVDTVAGGTGQR